MWASNRCVDLADFAGRGVDRAVIFHTDESIGGPFRKAVFVGMDDVQEDHLELTMAEKPDGAEDVVQVIDQEVAHDQEHAAPGEAAIELAQALAQPRHR